MAKQKAEVFFFFLTERCTEQRYVCKRVLICCVGSVEEGEHMRGGHGEVLRTDWWHQLSLREKTKPDSWSPVTATSAESATLDSYWVGGSITDTWHAQLQVSSELIKDIKMPGQEKFWFTTDLQINAGKFCRIKYILFKKNVFKKNKTTTLVSL